MVVVGEREDAFAGVRGADAEVVHPAGAADAHLAFGVEPVVAQPVVAVGVAVGRWERLWGWRGRRRLGCCGAARGGALLVVVLAELVELALQLRGAARLLVGR